MPSWVELGTILPRVDRWEDFPFPSITSAFFRITFIYSGGETSNNTRSFFLLRRVWTGETPLLVERAIKIYPTDNPVLINNPVGEGFLNAGLTLYTYQGKVGFRWKYRGVVENAYQVKLEEL